MSPGSVNHRENYFCITGRKKKNERVINMHIENNASGQIRLEP